MTHVRLEHANITVSDPERTARWMNKVFGWNIRWQGGAIHQGRSIHMGEPDSYIALYGPKEAPTKGGDSYTHINGLNHLAVVVGDLDAVETRVSEAGFTPVNHADYEPGRRFYFRDHDGIEFEVVQYD
ncbi:VOC family protein [Celeribacter neptunius]|uniref:Catechol 2,3-dioxygenase n=1 Tax=Celeribacter neptunius TaxID=588602 RepID=A0A1I3RZX3_9RHOB|nr:VOC family protein [Celeribacter neptunius]SFJ52174.1 Catechol 2,3-dioxygenase [Celeribacter neptunius]